VAELHQMSKELEERTIELGRNYASSMLMPLLMPCPFYRRAYEKPLGYAGDYRMMELCFEPAPTGDNLFGRFLQWTAQRSSLGQTVVAREEVLRDAVRQAVEFPGVDPVRILALAAGPAIELRNWLETTISVERPVEIVLLDQDPAAHEAAHRQLTRILFERHHGRLPITLQYLHFSVRQLIKPATPEEKRIRESLGPFDLVYSAGLYDYLQDLVAQRLTMLLYERLCPGGRMLLGNLVESPHSTWMMEYVLGWILLYRSDQQMLHLASRLAPSPTRLETTSDRTGRCIFLDVSRTI
jgi:extracellular factor (EF) 3-hydroxypalmitic acid methyl ester biosynthesis protein